MVKCKRFEMAPMTYRFTMNRNYTEKYIPIYESPIKKQLFANTQQEHAHSSFTGK